LSIALLPAAADSVGNIAAEEATMAQTYYEILGVPDTASPEEIKRAYRQQVLRWHPDRNQGSRESEERLKHIVAAYSVLSDPTERARYDECLRSGLGAAAQAAPQVDAETAAAMFFSEMVNLAFALTFQNVPWSRIARALAEKGCPESVAAEIARGVEKRRKAAVRKAAGVAFAGACGWILLGLIITAISYYSAEPGGHYIVTSGLFLFGGINLLRALYYLASGRAPKS
jgi:hypothetical protein